MRMPLAERDPRRQEIDADQDRKQGQREDGVDDPAEVFRRETGQVVQTICAG
jgi:hypothetical protein